MEFQPNYPEWLEAWWVEQVRRHMSWASGSLELDRLAPVVQALSDQFVDETHPPFAAYDHDVQTLLAYGLFFFPQTFVRTQWPVLELLRFRNWQPPTQRPLRILDLGAGLGGASLGVISALLALYPSISSSTIHLTAVDHGTQNLHWLQRMVQELSPHWPNVCLDIRHEDLWRYGHDQKQVSPDLTPNIKKPGSHHRTTLLKEGEPKSWPKEGKILEDPWDLVISSFALTEIFRGQTGSNMWHWLRGVLQRLDPDGLLLILEPASQDSCERLEDIRDRIAAEGEFHLWGPCLHQRSCPLLAFGQSWCHEVREWKAPDSLHFLNRKLFRDTQVLRFGFLMVGKQPPVASSFPKHTFRLISPVLKRKGHRLATGCSAEGNRLQIEIFQRDLERDQISVLEQMERGNLLYAPHLQKRSHEDQPQRYRLIEGETLSQIFPTPLDLSIATAKKS